MSLRTTLDFLLYDWLDVGSLQQRARFSDHSRETFDAVLDTCERIAREKYAPFNRLVDIEEPRFDGEKVILPQATHDAQRELMIQGSPRLDIDAGAGRQGAALANRDQLEFPGRKQGGVPERAAEIFAAGEGGDENFNGRRCGGGDGAGGRDRVRAGGELDREGPAERSPMLQREHASR